MPTSGELVQTNLGPRKENLISQGKHVKVGNSDLGPRKETKR